LFNVVLQSISFPQREPQENRDNQLNNRNLFGAWAKCNYKKNATD